MFRFPTLLLALCALAATGCSTVYYETMEKVGYHKREILANRITDVSKSQEAVKEEFQSTLEQFAAITNFDGGDLEKLYNRLSGSFEDSEFRASQLRERIDDVQNVAEAMFREWDAEIDEFTDPELARKSRRSLADTRTRYERLLSAMNRSESRLDPVLARFNDQVLFLKHNLNARAVTSLQTELRDIEDNVDDLIEAMNRSIAESQAFLVDFS